MGKYVILGAGGHAKIVLDILEQNKKDIYGLTDAGYEQGEVCCGYPVIGTDDILQSIYQQGIDNAVIGIGHIGYPAIRNKVYHTAKQIGFCFPNVIHPQAVVAESVIMEEGNLLAAGSVINAQARIGKLCIINTSAVVEHEVIIGDGVHIAPHATVLGAARIGDNSFVGAGSVILQGVKIGEDCIIGAGSVVLHDVEEKSVIVGNPGRLLKRR